MSMSFVRPRERPRVVEGCTYRVKTGCGNCYVIVNHDERGLLEVFATLGNTGQCAAAQTEAIGRLASMALRSGVDPAAIVRQLKGIRCSSPVLFPEEERCLSCPHAIAIALDAELERREGEDHDDG